MVMQGNLQTVAKGRTRSLYLHFCEKGIKTATRNYQQDILNKFSGAPKPKNRTLHPRIRPKLRNSDLKITYPNVLVVIIGRQPAQTSIHSTTNCGQFLEGLYKISPYSEVFEAGAGKSYGQFCYGCCPYSDRRMA